MRILNKFSCALVLVMCLTASVPARAQIERGVVVEEISKNSESERAGLQPGDLLLSWSRGDVKGDITSPFDLSLIEVEQSPRGRITLEGIRGEEKRIWAMGPDTWNIKARPNLPPDLLSLYREGQEMDEAGKISGAIERWQTAAAEAQKSPAAWLSTWLLFHCAEELAKVQRWKEADVPYAEALQQTIQDNPTTAIQVLQAWAMTYQQRSDWAKGEKYYQQAIIESRKLGADTLLAALGWTGLGTIASDRGRYQQAAEYHRRAMEIRERLAPGSLALADSLHELGAAAQDHGDVAKAEQYIRQAFAIRERLATGSLPVARSLNQLGFWYWIRGDYVSAEEYFRRAYAIREKLNPDSLDFATSLNNLGMVAEYHSELEEAERYYKQALILREKFSPDSLNVARSLNNLASLAQDRGELAAAEGYYRRALAICAKVVPNNTMVPLALDNLGSVVQTRGDLARAEEYCHRGLEAAQQISLNNVYVAVSFFCLGDLAAERHEWMQAENYLHRALAIYNRISNNNPHYYSAFVLSSLGRIREQRGDLNKAEKYYHQALTIYGRISSNSLDVAGELDHLGGIARLRGDLIKAEDYFRQSLAIREKSAPGSIGHAAQLAALAGIRRSQQKLKEATQLYEQALNAFESQTAHMGGSEEIRSGFRAKHASYYKEYVDLLVTQRQSELAFYVLERWRARSLLEMLGEAHLDIRKGVEPSIVEKERILQQAFNTKSQRRIQLLNDKHTDKQLADLDQAIKDVLDQYHEVEEQMRASSPAYAALTQPEPLSAKEVQQQLLDADTLLLEYSLGKERSYLFAVTPTSLNAYELPKRSEIELAAHHVYELVALRKNSVSGENAVQARARLTKMEGEYFQAITGLSRMVLAPVAAQVHTKRRLLIVSDGALQYIPFAVLLTPSAPDVKTAAVPLIAEHEIVNLPSASVLAVLRREQANRKLVSRAVAVLADPVFTPKDDRVQLASKNRMAGSPDLKPAADTSAPQAAEDTSSESSDLSRSAREIAVSADGSFPRLPFTRREADAIYSITGKQDSLEAVDFDASKATALSSQLKNYRIVHFATHGLLNNDHPELSGLVFSLVDKQGNSQDGFLRMLDIYNMELNADLVVLSACQTALGKEIGEEGLIGLTRGFMYAGAPRVVASLWKVDDEATAALMKKFYEGMLREHQTPAQALRSAQQWMRTQKAWQSPYYWAGFELQGEWK